MNTNPDKYQGDFGGKPPKDAPRGMAAEKERDEKSLPSAPKDKAVKPSENK